MNASAWLVHLYTASSAVMGLLAAANVFESDYDRAFLWLAGAVIVDATDGMFARRANVGTRLPHFDGALLDNIVDYVTYVFVPALLVWQALIVPDSWSIPVCAAMLLSSAYGFSSSEAKTADHYFTGFPSYWNIVVFYLYAADWSPVINAFILLVLAALVFVPVRYVYPSRTPVLRTMTVALGVLWGTAILALVLQGSDRSRTLFWVSLIFPTYYLVLSLVLTARRRRLQAA
jgi:phosphatidylcholine synthase